MAMTKPSAFTFLHANQVDALYTVYTSTQIKTFFDSQAVQLKTYLNDTLTAEIDTTLATKVELANAVLSGLSADSITNTYLATDVKVGSLAALATTVKTSITNAINSMIASLNPIGSVVTMATTTVPTGYLECNGAVISRTTYAGLFGIVGETFGAGDNATTFSLPDLRGEYIRGYDDARGIDVDRVFGSYQQGTIAISHAVGSLNSATTYPDGFDADNQFKVRNIALMYCIKY